MENKHLIMGTAGHVDHGKTTIIKALTGFDCDTHKQEKDRGITINLGFSHLDLPGGNSVGIVDVPGHADFIKTMVAGACGIDFVLFIISADEGIMQQTSEHLEIMKILDVKHGIIVLTKIDLVDSELLELAVEEVSEFVQDSFLADAPIIQVSSTTGDGIPELLAAISKIIEEIPARNNEGLFRMYIDRVFTREGFGTIMNGSVISGSINRNDPVYMLPGNKELRIRRLEHHGVEVDNIKAGDRASFNLVGFKQKDFKRGMVLSNRLLEPTKLIDVKVRIFQKEITLGLWSQVIFLSGTNRLMCRMHLLDKDVLQNGENGLAQIYLPQEIITHLGDKFIIRNSSGNLTIGGGHVVDPYPLHHRRRRPNHVETVKKISGGELHQLVAAEVRKTTLPISHKDIASILDVNPDDLIDVIFQQLPGDIIFFQKDDNILLMMKKIATATQNKILTNLQEFHKKNPLRENGRTFKELMGIFGSDQNDSTRDVLKLMLEKLVENGKLALIDRTWKLSSHRVQIDSNMTKSIEEIDSFMQSIGNASADLTEISAAVSSNISEKQLSQILNYMIDTKTIHFIQKRYLHSSFVEKSKKIIVEHIKNNSDGITVAQFRDMIAGNRTNAILMLDLMDNNGITLRKGNNRFLTKKYLESNK